MSQLSKYIFFLAIALLTLCIAPAHAVNHFNFIIAGDPEAWRLNNGDPDAESNRQPWLNMANATYSSMQSLDAKFLIINGDMTDYGRSEMWQDTASAYGHANLPVLYGLGNHDYANNVGDCSDGINNFKDTCAAESVDKFITKYYPGPNWTNYGGLDGLNIIRNDWTYGVDNDKLMDKITGSLSYSFEYGGVHFIQLNLCPTYTRNITNDPNFEIYITDSLNWLDNDIKAARAFGYRIVLNYHQPYNDNGYCPESDRFLALAKQVDIVFVGHLHTFATDHVLGPPRFTVDAIFHGGYYLVSVSSAGFTVSKYNGQTGQANALDQGTLVPFAGAPAAPVISTPANNASVTVPPDVPINGTGVPGATVQASIMNDTLPKPYVFCNRTVTQSGTWDCFKVQLVTDGTNTVTVTQTAGGLQSLPASNTFTAQVSSHSHGH